MCREWPWWGSENRPGWPTTYKNMPRYNLLTHTHLLRLVLLYIMLVCILLTYRIQLLSWHYCIMYIWTTTNHHNETTNMEKLVICSNNNNEKCLKTCESVSVTAPSPRCQYLLREKIYNSISVCVCVRKYYPNLPKSCDTSFRLFL